MSQHFGFRPGRRPLPPAGTPVYSLITVVRNAARTIEKALESVARQNYPAIEYIVVDAGSTDGTVDILTRYEHLISQWCSEPDPGATDALNKGLKIASGQFIGFLFADDWLDDFFIEESVRALQRSKADFVFGDLHFYREGSFYFTVKGDIDYKKRISYRAPNMNYPSISACAYVYRQAGLYNPAYKVAPDYEWLFRVHHAGFSGVYDSSVCYHFSLGGNSMENVTLGVIEVARAAARHDGDKIKIFAFAALKIVFHSVDNFLMKRLSPSAYRKIRSARKVLTG